MNSHTPHDDIDSEFARRLRTRLDAEAYDLPHGAGPEAAVSRAGARRRTRRAVLASAAALAVIAGATSQTLSDDPGDVGLDTAQETMVDDSLTFDWTVTEDGLSSTHEYSAGDSGLYALSTAPRTRKEDYPQGNAPRAMYRLSDDGTWTPIALEGDDTPNVSTMSERGGALYALSTGPASGADGGPVGSVSTDGGESWSSVPLEMPTPPSDDVAWTVSYSLDIASTADRTIALVAADMHLPYEDVFPELYSDDEAGYTTDITDDGIDLVRGDHTIEAAELQEAAASGAPVSPAGDHPDDAVDPEAGASPPSTSVPAGIGEVVRTVTWAELGITGPDDLLPQRWAYAADGDEWNAIATPSTNSTAPTVSSHIATVGDRFLLTVEEYSDDDPATVTSYLSADGQDWSSIDGPGSGQLHATGDGLVHIGYSSAGDVELVQVSRDLGATWSPLDLRSLDPAMEDLDHEHFVYGSAGPLGVALVVQRQGEGEAPDVPLMLFSTDLEAWSVTDLADVLPDGNGYIGSVLVGTDRVAILGHTNVGEPGSPERSATLTGVPRRT